jgi:hypothetical protein
MLPGAAVTKNCCAVAPAVLFVPPTERGRVPVMPVVAGRPVALVSTSEEGVPRFGVVIAHEIVRHTLPEPLVP